ncbi:SRPBCC family protein [Chitinibacteraceae bacterium HSL-7]
MIHADHRYTLPVGPAEAFAYLANPGNDAEWQSSCEASELLGTAPVPGCRYRIRFSFLGRKMDFFAEITESTAPSEYAFRVLEGSFYYEGRYSFRPADEGCEVHWQFSADPGRFFGILPASLLRKVLISQVERDVVNLRRHFAALQPA